MERSGYVAARRLPWWAVSPVNSIVLPGIGESISTDSVSTVNGAAVAPPLKTERVKVVFGADGTSQDVDPAHPLPMTDSAAATSLVAILSALNDPAQDATVSALVSLLGSPGSAPPVLTGAGGGQLGYLRNILDALRSVLATPSDLVTAVVNGRVTVPSPGTAVVLGASAACKWVSVSALSSNSSQVNVGGAGVLASAGASTGIPLAAGSSVTIPVDNVSKVFVDARVANEGVSFVRGA